jgi:hypothetical protein
MEYKASQRSFMSSSTSAIALRHHRVLDGWSSLPQQETLFC